jgi:hypothetical protein
MSRIRNSKRNRATVRLVCVQVVLLCILWLSLVPPIVAQEGPISWSKPLDLSNTPRGSGHPAVITDGYGYVHVFWSEDMDGRLMRPQDALPSGNSLLYSRWDGESWTEPNDILSVPNDTLADFVSVTIDSNNRLHVVWSGQQNIYYSSAPSWQAHSAQAWSKPVILSENSARSSYMNSIAADNTSGDLHVAYATRGQEAGVYYTRSIGGETDWTSPVKLSVAFDDLEDSFANVQIVLDGAGRLHAVWQTNQSEGYGQAIYYARSVDHGETWSQAIQLGYRGPDDFDVGLPYIVARGSSELHLIYQAGSKPIGRYHRISRDGGATWTEPIHILTDMEGINGYIVPLVDGAGRMHLIVNMRTRDTQVVGIYYSSWLETGWSPVRPLATEAPYGPSAHYTAATVGSGNELHVVWTQLRLGEIWYLRGIIAGVTSVPTLPRPLPETPTPALSPTRNAPTPTSKSTPQPTAQQIDRTFPATASVTKDNSLVYGVGASLVLVLGCVITITLRRDRR